FLQRMDHRARSAAGAENDGRPVVLPAGRMLVQICREAVRVGVAADERAVLEPERVDGADQLRGGVAASDGGKGCLLVRDGDVTASEAPLFQRCQKGGEIFRRDIGRLVAAVDTVAV